MQFFGTVSDYTKAIQGIKFYHSNKKNIVQNIRFETFVFNFSENRIHGATKRASGIKVAERPNSDWKGEPYVKFTTNFETSYKILSFE